MTDRKPTVILADDHPMVLDGLRKLLEPTLDIVATVSDGEALLEHAARLRPDLVVADASMPHVDGIAATRRLVEVAPQTKVMILSFHTEPSWVRSAFDAGAWAYLGKTAGAEEIENAIREVLGGSFYVSPSVTRGLVSPSRTITTPASTAPSNDVDELTPRERDAVELVGQGLSNKEIASQLGLSITTIRTHLSSAYHKLGLTNRVELALYAARSSEPGTR